MQVWSRKDVAYCMHAFPPKRLSFPMTPMDGDTPASPSNVASRARYFEELLRSHVQLSFSRRRRSSSGGMGVELTDLAATECVASTSGDEGAAQLTRQVCSRAFASPLARMSSCRRTEDALEGLIAETSRIMSTQPESSNHAEKLEALSQRLADVAHALSSKVRELQGVVMLARPCACRCDSPRQRATPTTDARLAIRMQAALLCLR